MLVALNLIAQSQSNPTQHTAQLCYHLLDHCAMYPNVGLALTKMIWSLTFTLMYHTLLLHMQKGESVDIFFSHQILQKKTYYAPIHIECKTLRHVLTSSAECETGAIFHNTQTAIHTRYMLQQLGHSQPPTLIILDNSTTENFIKNNITQKRSNDGI